MNPKSLPQCDTFASYDWNRARNRWELITFTAPPADRKWFTLRTEVPAEFLGTVVVGNIDSVKEPQGVMMGGLAP